MKKRDGKISDIASLTTRKGEGHMKKMKKKMKSLLDKMSGMVTMMRFGHNVRKTKKQLMKMSSKIK